MLEKGWGGHIGAPPKPINKPATKAQMIRKWCEQGWLEAPGKSGNLVRIDIYHATNEAYEQLGGRPFDSLVSTTSNKAFFVLFCDDRTAIVPPSTRPILCIPGLAVSESWWVLPNANS